MAISTSGVTKAFGRTVALRGVDLTLEWGQCLALFGQNGAGKTTLLRILAGLTQPSAGSVQVAGHDHRTNAPQLRAAVGFLGHQSLLYDALTPRENLTFYARLYALQNVHQRATELMDQLGITPWAHRRVGVLSNGMRKRVALARVLLHQPRVLLLDEPEAGLDQQGLEVLEGVLQRAVSGGASVVMTTHSLEWGLAAADQVAVLERGKMALVAPRAGVDRATVVRTMSGGAT